MIKLNTGIAFHTMNHLGVIPRTENQLKKYLHMFVKRQGYNAGF